MLASFKVTPTMKGLHRIWMPPPVSLHPFQSTELSLLSQTGRTCVYTHKVQITQQSQQVADRSNGAPFSSTAGEMRQQARQERVGTAWHPQEANANLQLCHFSPHRHPKCCSCEVMSVVMVTVCEPGIAHPPTSPLPPSLAPPFPPHSLILSFPSHARKSIAETNVKWLQKRKLLAAALPLCTSADEIAAKGGWGRLREGLGVRLNVSLQKSPPFHRCEATAGRGLLILVEKNA